VAVVSRKLVVFLSGAGWEARYQAVSVAVTAAAMGDEVTLALAFDPLRAFVHGRFDAAAPPGAAAAGVPGLAATLLEARRDLGLRVVACETSVRLAGIDVEAARAALDALEPLPELWRRARGGRVLSF
jgi:peroxiredoxin family protein